MEFSSATGHIYPSNIYEFYSLMQKSKATKEALTDGDWSECDNNLVADDVDRMELCITVTDYDFE